MFYSYRCTYCGRLFYTFSNSKEAASHVLYRAIKEHLIEYNEDDKEHEMDDGESIDSNEIYYHIVESNEKPAGGYEAEDDGILDGASGGSSSGGTSSGLSQFIFYIIFAVLIGVVIVYFFFGKNLPFSIPGISLP